MALVDKLRPAIAKIRGNTPFCPWQSALCLLDPRLLRVYPPRLNIKEVGREEGLVCFRFANTRDFWFPEKTIISPELWSEYLVVFWDHVKNFHHYVSGFFGLSSTDVVFDCGACEGFFTRFALESGVREVVSIEPSAQMSQALARTFKDEIKNDKVCIQNVALSSISAKAHFSFDESNAFGGRLEKEGATEVKVTTIDILSQELVVPTFIKMDLEGCEYEALRGGLQTLGQYHPRIAATTYHFPHDYAVIYSFLRTLGYTHCRPQGVTDRGGKCFRPYLIKAA